MAIRSEEMTTSQNKSAEAGLPAYVPGKAGPGNVNGLQVGQDSANPVREGDDAWLSLVKQAKMQNETYQSGPKLRWAQAYRAYNNQHFSDSKYLSDRWRGRSKLHRPKTRNAVHKADARAANALFASQDVVQTTASNPGDPKNQASADILREVLNYRLSRSSGKAGLPWFEVAVGAHNDARITAVCISKQYWERREVWNGELEPVMGEPQPAIDEMGQPAVDQQGQPVMAPPQPVMEPSSDGTMVQKMKKVTEIINDRPMVRLYPVEYCWRDPAANWVDQAQNGSYIALLHPMSVGDAFAMLNTDINTKSAVQWRPLTKEQLNLCRQPTELGGTQAARDQQGTDRYDINTTDTDLRTCWLIEWFVRRDGREWHFWTGACMFLASEPIPVKKAYPCCGGERPVVIGVSALEPHKIDPISPVMTALPLQQEMNDLVNLRMDGVKETVRPLTIVRAGSQIDSNAIQNRSGDTVVYAKDPKNDIEFDRPGAIGGEAYTEMAHLNADFDDVSGEFNGSSVAMNRQIGETVGGMKLLNTSANITSDFDLTVWIATWAEPVLRQLMKVIQYYEDDKTILAIAYDKAKLFTKFGVDQITNDLLEREILVTVDVGIGTSDPSVALEKFAMAAKIAGAVCGPEIQARVKQDAVVDVVFSKAGFKGAAERFFYPGDSATDPRLQKAKDAIGTLQAQVEDKQADRQNKIELARINAASALLKQYLANIATAEAAQVQQQHAMEGKVVDHAANLQSKAVDAANAKDQAAAAGKQRLAEIKAKPLPGAKGKAAAPAAPAEDPTHSPASDAVMQALMVTMAHALMPNAGGPVTPPAAGGSGSVPTGQPQPPATQPPQGPDPTQAMMAQMQQQTQMFMAMMQQLAQGMQAMVQSNQMLAQVMAAPKTVVKDQNGRISGIQIAGGGGMPALPAPAGLQ